MKKRSPSARDIRSQYKRAEKQASIARRNGLKLALPYLLGDPYPEDHPVYPGVRPITGDSIRAVARGMTGAPLGAVAFCVEYCMLLGRDDLDGDVYDDWDWVAHDLMGRPDLMGG